MKLRFICDRLIVVTLQKHDMFECYYSENDNYFVALFRNVTK